MHGFIETTSRLRRQRRRRGSSKIPCVNMLHKLFWVQKAVCGAGAEVMRAQHRLQSTVALPQLLTLCTSMWTPMGLDRTALAPRAGCEARKL